MPDPKKLCPTWCHRRVATTATRSSRTTSQRSIALLLMVGAYPYNNVRREAWPTRKVAHEIRENTKSVEDKQNPGTVTGVKPGEDDPGTAVEV